MTWTSPTNDTGELLSQSVLKNFTRENKWNWQPIETAPKDRPVLLYGCQHHRHIFGTGYWFQGVPGDGEGWIANGIYSLPTNDFRGSFTPSHWMPMFEPPG